MTMNASRRADPEGRVRSLSRLMMWSGIAALLVLPMVAMQFTREINWTAEDFAAAAILLVGAGLVYDLVVRRLGNWTWRAVAGVALLGALLGIWAQGAVGIV